jgi:hypothetical protein
MTALRTPNQQRGFVLACLWGIAVLLIAVAGATFWAQRAATGGPVVSGKVLPNFSSDLPLTRTITITTSEGTYTLVRQGDAWVMPERDNYPVSSQALSTLAKNLGDLRYKAAQTSDPNQFARLGVDDPTREPSTPSRTGSSTQLSLKNATGQILHSLFLGQKGEALFVRKTGSNEVFEAQGDLPNFERITTWLDLKVIDIAPETIASVSGGRTGAVRYDIVRRPDGGFAPVGGVANVTATTAAIALTSWNPIDVVGASTLTSDPIGTHVTLLRTGISITVTAYQERGKNWVVLSADANDESQQEAANKINRRTDNWAFALDQTAFENLTFPTRAVVEGPNAGPQ